MLEIFGIEGAVTPPPGTYSFTGSTTVTFAVVSPYDPDPNDGTRLVYDAHFFDGDLDGASGFGPFTIQADSVANISFLEELEVVSGGTNGTVTGAGWYLSDATILLEAIPDPGFQFVRWEGDIAQLDPTENPLDFTTSTPREIRAVFVPAETVTLTITGSFNPAIISPEPVSTPSFGSHTYAVGSTVTVSMLQTNYITYAAGNPFFSDLVIVRDWEANGSITNGTGDSTGPFVITEDTTLRWRWALVEYVDIESTVGGTTSLTGQLTVTSQQPRSITATPDEGYRFERWSNRYAEGRQYDPELTLAHASNNGRIASSTTAIFVPKVTGLDESMLLDSNSFRDAFGRPALTWPSSAGEFFWIESASDIEGPYRNVLDRVEATPPRNVYIVERDFDTRFFRVVRSVE